MTSKIDWRVGRPLPRCTACGATLQERGPWINERPRRQKKKRQNVRSTLKPTAESALAELDSVAAKASRRGIAVRHSMFQTRWRPSVHVMFETFDGERLLDYWPGNGTVKTQGGERREAENIDDALELAIEMQLSITHGSTDDEFPSVVS